MISVILPTFNRAHYLAESINSILNQTYKDFELIVVDDGSTDSTPTLMEYFSKDNRVKHFRLKKNMGIAYARNYGIDKSTGEYIAVMDSDDLCHPDRLKKELKALKDDFVYSSYFLADEHAKIKAIHYPPAKVGFEHIKKNDSWPHVTILAKRKCFEENPYRDYRVNDDAFLVWDWFKAGYKANWVKEPLVIVRTHDSSVSRSKAESVAKTQDILDKEYEDFARSRQ